MEYRYLDKSGLKVSEVCLGTMTFSRETEEKTAKAMIDRFLDMGGNFIDTANVYGKKRGASEEIVGRALKGKRKKIVQLMKALGLSERYGWQRFVCLQPQYSLVVRDIERGSPSSLSRRRIRGCPLA